MNLTQAHVLAVIVICICATLLGALHSMATGDVTNVFVASLGSLSGHAVGYAAGQKALVEAVPRQMHVTSTVEPDGQTNG